MFGIGGCGKCGICRGETETEKLESVEQLGLQQVGPLPLLLTPPLSLSLGGSNYDYYYYYNSSTHYCSSKKSARSGSSGEDEGGRRRGGGADGEPFGEDEEPFELEMTDGDGWGDFSWN